jgi:hypothetical protein
MDADAKRPSKSIVMSKTLLACATTVAQRYKNAACFFDFAGRVRIYAVSGGDECFGLLRRLKRLIAMDQATSKFYAVGRSQ